MKKSESKEAMEYKKITQNPLICVFVQNDIKKIMGNNEETKLII
jgi:hypothetical protein